MKNLPRPKVAASCLSFLLLASPLAAELAPAWMVARPEFGWPGALHVATDKDFAGNLFFVCIATNVAGAPVVYTAKQAAQTGATLWEHRVTLPGLQSSAELAVDPAGNVLLGGSSWEDSNPLCHVFKLSGTNGSVLWQTNVPGRWPVLALDFHGNALLGGAGGVFVMKISGTNGAVLWERRLANDPPAAPNFDSILTIVATAQGDVVVNRHTAYIYKLAKFAGSNGSTLWETNDPNYDIPVYFGPQPRTLAMDPNGDVLVYRYQDSSSSNNYVGKFSGTNGARLWRVDETNYVKALAVDSRGQVFVAGYSQETGDDEEDHAYVAAFSGTNGASLWRSSAYVPGLSNLESYFDDAQSDANDDLILLGFFERPSPVGEKPGLDLVTARYAGANGNVLWKKSVPLLANAHSVRGESDGFLGDLIVSSNGAIYSTVSIDRRTHWSEVIPLDFLTVRYAAELPPVSITRAVSSLHVEFQGIAGQTYRLQHAATFPGGWQTILTTNPAAGGQIRFTTNSTGPAGFYRIATDP